MFYIKVADLNVCIKNKYEYVELMCRDYVVPTVPAPELVIEVTDDEIASEQTASYPNGYLESLAIYRKIAVKMFEYNGFLMHGVIIETDNTGIGFFAKSGVGKSTHASLRKELLRDKITVINGDKPLVRFSGGKAFAYGTPWAGKEGEQTNKRTHLKKICFIERSEKNECIKISASEALTKLFSYIYTDNGKYMMQTLKMTDMLLKTAEFYVIRCNMDLSAAKTAYEVIIG